jgi:hypothetical protein
MKKIYSTLLFTFSVLSLSAQVITPINVSTIAEMKELEWTIPGMRNGTTKLKYLVSPTKVGFETAFSFNIIRDASNNVTNMETADINVNYPLDLKYKCSGVVSGNMLNVMVQTADNTTSEPFKDAKKERIYKNLLGLDSMLVVENLNGQNQYEEIRRLKLIYNMNGKLICLQELLPESNNYEMLSFRNLGYSGDKLITDTTYLVTSGGQETVGYNKFFYNASAKLDSMMSFSVSQGTSNLEAGYRMVYDANPGISEIYVTRVTNNVPSFEFRILYIGTMVTSTNEIKLNADNQISCYPVPANQILNVSPQGSELYHYTLFDATGKLMLKYNDVNKVTLNTSELSSGLYFLSIQDLKGNNSTQKIIIQH